MALTIVTQAIVASAAVAAATTVTGAGVATSADYENAIQTSIVNGATAPTTVPKIQVQSSPDNTAWFNEFTVGGDLVASSNNTITYTIGPRNYLRAILTSGATTGSTMGVTSQAVTGY